MMASFKNFQGIAIKTYIFVIFQEGGGPDSPFRSVHAFAGRSHFRGVARLYLNLRCD